MVKVEFDFTEELFLELCTRYRQSGKRRVAATFFRLLGGSTCLYFAVQTWRSSEWWFLAFFMGALIFFLCFTQIMSSIARHNHRRSPYSGEHVEMEFTENGLDIKSPTTDVQCRWSGITSAIEFADGLMLFRGPLFHWVPARVITSEGGIRELRELVKANVSDYSVAKPLEA